MLTLPDVIIPLLQPFKVMFQARTWSKAQVLLIGAILATRKRTVTSALRVMGLRTTRALPVTTTVPGGRPSGWHTACCCC